MGYQRSSGGDAGIDDNTISMHGSKSSMREAHERAVDGGEESLLRIFAEHRSRTVLFLGRPAFRSRIDTQPKSTIYFYGNCISNGSSLESFSVAKSVAQMLPGWTRFLQCHCCCCSSVDLLLFFLTCNRINVFHWLFLSSRLFPSRRTVCALVHAW